MNIVAAPNSLILSPEVDPILIVSHGSDGDEWVVMVGELAIAFRESQIRCLVRQYLQWLGERRTAQIIAGLES